MLLNILRGCFILLVIAVAMSLAEQKLFGPQAMLIYFGALVGACLIIGFDLIFPQKSLLAISGLFFGLVVGMLLAFGVNLIVELIVDTMWPTLANSPDSKGALALNASKLLVGVICCYLTTSFILQTKDDIRFVIPYVEFAKEKKGQRPLLLDTSVIIDGRIVDVLNTWPVDNPVVVPRFVLDELQLIADSADKLKRNRGRRGLDIVGKLREIERIELQFQEHKGPDDGLDVDHRLIAMAIDVNGRVVTNDYNLNKVAQIRGVEVLNVNDLANAIKPVFLPGEAMRVRIIKPGEERGQGVGYLEDGTMVVVEGAREQVNNSVPVIVTSVLQTSAGRMVFGKLDEAAPPSRVPQRS